MHSHHFFGCPGSTKLLHHKLLNIIHKFNQYGESVAEMLPSTIFAVLMSLRASRFIIVSKPMRERAF